MILSKNAIAIILLISALIGLDVDEQLASDLASALTLVFSFSVMVWNQISRTDTKWFLLKK